MNNEKKPKTVPCPTCGKNVKWSEDKPERPFCSERCKLIDLGEWADEGYKISDNNKTDQND